MLQELKQESTAHSRLPVITSLLLIGFCLFKTERYLPIRDTFPATAGPVVELVIPHIPWSHLPERIDNQPLYKVTTAQPPRHSTHFEPVPVILQRQFQRRVSLLIRLCKNRAYATLSSSQRSRMLLYSDESSDIPPLFSHS